MGGWRQPGIYLRTAPAAYPRPIHVHPASASLAIKRVNISINLIMFMIMRVYVRPCKWVAPPHRALRAEGAGHA